MEEALPTTGRLLIGLGVVLILAGGLLLILSRMPGNLRWDRPGISVHIGTYRPDLTAGPSRSRVVGDPHGIAPRRAEAPVPRAETGTDGSPARTKMLIAALWSAFARNPQAPHANTACDGRLSLCTWPHRLHVCDV